MYTTLSAGLLTTCGQVINSIVCLKVSNVYNSYHMRKLFKSFWQFAALNKVLLGKYADILKMCIMLSKVLFFY